MPIGTVNSGLIHPNLYAGGAGGLNRLDQTCTVMRDNVVAGKVAGKVAVAELSDIACSPLHPLRPEQVSTEGLEQFSKLAALVMGVAGVKQGDSVVLNSAEYAVIAVDELRGHVEVVVGIPRSNYGA
jgi:hypothetical protein